MQEKEWNKLNFPSGFYNVYRGIPLYRDVIIKTKDNKTIIGELKYVSLYENGDILYLQTKEGEIDIDTNNIDDIDLYIEQENDFELDDIVEIINIDKLNRVLYDGYPKGFNKTFMGLQGKIIMIDNVTTKGITYYVVDLPIKNPRIYDGCYNIDGKTIFLKENLKLIRKGGNYKMSKKEQLLNELEQIKKEFKEKIENVQKQIDKEYNKREVWKPNNGEKYYFIASDGGVSISANTDMSDIRKMDFLNYFKTKKEAERVAFEQLLHKKLQKFAYENNEEEIDWNNEKQFKWCIVYQYESNYTNSLMIDYCMTSKDFGQIYFTSKEIVEKAIKEFRDDLMKYFNK